MWFVSCLSQTGRQVTDSFLNLEVLVLQTGDSPTGRINITYITLGTLLELDRYLMVEQIASGLPSPSLRTYLLPTYPGRGRH